MVLQLITTADTKSETDEFERLQEVILEETNSDVEEAWRRFKPLRFFLVGEGNLLLG